MIKPALGVCYYPEHWPRDLWDDDARRMAETGIIYVRIAEFAWSRIEPARGQFDFGWLDDAVETLGAHGLKIVMCTPTATPPKWLVDEMPDMLALDERGRPRGFGSRRHYCFSHAGYRQECVRITEMLAKRYGTNPHVAAWQTDNEYGCHDTTISYSKAARDGFRDWLAQKYQSPAAVNRAWGKVFWSKEVTGFDQIELPNLTVTEANPAHRLDFQRYSSDQVVAFNRLQTGVLRKHSPGRDIIHNFMGRTLEFDHFDVSRDLDVASWDSYPIGFLERFGRDNAWKNWYMRAGDPDFQAFHHDLYRGCGTVRQKTGAGSGRWWVMEQQPGPVNWAAWNPDPHPGMVRLWSHEAFAHGAEVVSYFRWRQAPFAQEQMHTGLNRSDNSPDRGLEEARQVTADLATLPPVETKQSCIALVFDYSSLWASQIQPQGADFDGFDLIFDWYRALRKLGQSIDIIPASTSLENYSLVLVPHFLMPTEEFVERAKNSTARIIFGPRCGSRTEAHNIPETLPPGLLQDLIPIKIVRVESLRPGNHIQVGHEGSVSRWFEHVETAKDVTVIHANSDKRPVYLSSDNTAYLAGWPDESLLHAIISSELQSLGLPMAETGEDLRIRDRGNLRTIVNYGPREHDASHLIGKNDRILIGGSEMPVAGVTIVQRVS